MKHKARLLAAAVAVMLVPLSTAQAQLAPACPAKIGRTLADSRECWPDPVKAPAGAPNIVWVLIDDVGFGAASVFGGQVSTPVLDSLAQQGLRYTNFHTTAI